MPNPVSFQWLPVTIFCKIIVYIIEVLKELKKKINLQFELLRISWLVCAMNEMSVSPALQDLLIRTPC